MGAKTGFKKKVACYNCKAGAEIQDNYDFYLCHACGAYCHLTEYQWYCFWTRHIKNKVSSYVATPDGRRAFLMIKTLPEMLAALEEDPYVIAAEYEEPEAKLRLITLDGAKELDCVFSEAPERFNEIAEKEEGRVIHCMSIDEFLSGSKTKEEEHGQGTESSPKGQPGPCELL